MTVFRRILRKTMALMNQVASTRIIIMLVLSLSMWVMVKLRNTYTTDVDLKLYLDGHRYELGCVFEGEGMKLLSYFIFPPEMKITLDDVQHRTVKVYDEDPDNGKRKELVRKIRIAHKSLVDVVNVKFSDIKVISVGEIPDIPIEK